MGLLRFTGLALVLLAGSSSVAPIAAQDAAELEATLQDLRARLAQERRSLQELQTELEAQQGELEGERESLAESYLEARLERDGLLEELRGLESERERLSSEVDAGLQFVRRSLNAAQTSAERLLLHLQRVPGTEAARESAREIERELRNEAKVVNAARRTAGTPGDEEPPRFDPERWEALSVLYWDTLADACVLQVATRELYVADGTLQTVELLSVGHLRFAYRYGERFGVALESPGDASGLRWSESLDDAARALLEAAFEQAAAPASPDAWIEVPLDPTGKLRADAVAAPTLVERLQSGGPLMIPLAALLGLAALLTLERVFALYVRNRRGHGLARRVLEACRAGNVQEAEARAERAGGTVGRTLSACLAQRAHGKDAMEDAIQTQLLHEMPGLQRFLKTLALLAAVAPLVGLLGTVTGIIQTFGVIRTLGTTDPALMASGISVALVTTAAGLSVAIPVLLVQGLLRGRGERILGDAERHSASLLMVLAHAGVGSTPPARSEVEAVS